MSLADQLGGPDGDLLDLHRLLTGQWPAQGTHPDLGYIRKEWQNASAVRKSLERHMAEGFRAAIVLSESIFFDAVKQSGAALPLIVPIVPNIQGLMRDAVEHGMAGAGLRRAWRTGLIALAGMGLRNITNVGAL